MIVNRFDSRREFVELLDELSLRQLEALRRVFCDMKGSYFTAATTADMCGVYKMVGAAGAFEVLELAVQNAVAKRSAHE